LLFTRTRTLSEVNYVDHTQHDITSFLRFITRRFDLPLPGLPARDTLLRANGHPAMGDLGDSLTFWQVDGET
jgi:phospholipase C